MALSFLDALRLLDSLHCQCGSPLYALGRPQASGLNLKLSTDSLPYRCHPQLAESNTAPGAPPKMHKQIYI